MCSLTCVGRPSNGARPIATRLAGPGVAPAVGDGPVSGAEERNLVPPDGQVADPAVDEDESIARSAGWAAASLVIMARSFGHLPNLGH